MKDIYMIALLFCLFCGCKRKESLLEIAPKPDPQPTGMTKAQEFLKTLQVTGSTSISFDSASNSYLVSLPDDFNQNKVEVKLALQPNVFLVDSLDKSSADTIIHYTYQADGPLMFQLRDKSNKYWYFFNVYFNFTGTPDIELLKSEIPVNASGAKVPFRFKARVGSIPATPNGPQALVKFTNKTTRFSISGNVAIFNNATVLYGMVNSLGIGDPYTMELTLQNQKPVTFDNIRFIRDTPAVYLSPNYKFEYTRKDTIKITGGQFLPEEKYTMTFSNDFMALPVTAQVQFKDTNTLTVNKIPAGLPEGTYFLSVYEKGKLVGNDHIYISGNTPTGIETIWQGGLEMATIRNNERIVLRRGDEFYAKTWPAMTGYAQSHFDSKKLPQLHFESVVKTTDLVPQIATYSWAIAGFTLGFGKYKIPNSLPPGSYTVTAIFEDGTHSKPYWCRIDIK